MFLFFLLIIIWADLYEVRWLWDQSNSTNVSLSFICVWGSSSQGTHSHPPYFSLPLSTLYFSWSHTRPFHGLLCTAEKLPWSSRVGLHFHNHGDPSVWSHSEHHTPSCLPQKRFPSSLNSPPTSFRNVQPLSFPGKSPWASPDTTARCFRPTLTSQGRSFPPSGRRKPHNLPFTWRFRRWLWQQSHLSDLLYGCPAVRAHGVHSDGGEGYTAAARKIIPRENILMPAHLLGEHWRCSPWRIFLGQGAAEFTQDSISSPVSMCPMSQTLLRQESRPHTKLGSEGGITFFIHS